MSMRTPLLSLKKSTVCDEFESCESSLDGEDLPRSPRFGQEDDQLVDKQPAFPRKLLSAGVSLKHTLTQNRPAADRPSPFDEDDDADRKSSVNSPILTAGRLSFAPLLMVADAENASRKANNIQKSQSLDSKRKPEKDYVASIDQIVKDILNVTHKDGSKSARYSSREVHQPAAGRISFGKPNNNSPIAINKTPRDYKRRSLTARAAPPGPKLPDLLRFHHITNGGGLSARRCSNAFKTTPEESSGDDEQEGQHTVRLERRLSLSKRADEVMANLTSVSNHNPNAAGEAAPTVPVNNSSRTSMDPFLLDTSPSPPTTPFKSATRPGGENQIPTTKSLPTTPRAEAPTQVPHEQDQDLAESTKKVTKKIRDRLASHYYAFYNELIFSGSLPPSLPIEWNSRFIRVSGRTTFGRKVIAQAGNPGADAPMTPRAAQEDDDVPTTKSYFRSDALSVVHTEPGGAQVSVTPICISLSSKLLTTAERLKATLLHEMCHVAQMLFEDSAQEHGAHGKSFLKWLDIARAKAPDVKVQVAHDYSLDAPHFRWSCRSCNQVYQRMQNSINCDEYVCSSCQGTLEFLGKYDKIGKLVKAGKKPSAYNQFMKENYPILSAKGLSHKAAMSQISVMWNDHKNIS